MEVQTFFETYNAATIIALLVCFIVVIQKIYEWVKWGKDRLTDYYNKRKGIEKKEQTIEERIARLEAHDTKQYQQLQDILKAQTEIKTLLLESQEQNRQNEVAGNRYILNEIAEKTLSRGTITQTEYETFCELANRYIAQGGNHSMKEKIIPQVKKLPIQD